MYSQVSDREKVTQIKETHKHKKQTMLFFEWNRVDNVHEHSSYEFKFF